MTDQETKDLLHRIADALDRLALRLRPSPMFTRRTHLFGTRNVAV